MTSAAADMLMSPLRAQDRPSQALVGGGKLSIALHSPQVSKWPVMFEAVLAKPTLLMRLD